MVGDFAGRFRNTGDHILGRLPRERLWLVQQGQERKAGPSAGTPAPGGRLDPQSAGGIEQ